MKTSKIIQKMSKRHFCFKNKINIFENNILIKRNPTYLEITVDDVKETNLDKKAFIFKTDSSLENIIKSIENEYGVLFNLSDDLKSKISMKLCYNKYETKQTNFINEINNIKSNLKLNSKQMSTLLEDSSKEALQEYKRLFFMISSQIEDMNRTKEIIDKKILFRINFVFLAIILFLVGVTSFFYHCIYNIEDLGWDIVEPTTYLFSSLIFLGCLFGFVKLQKKGAYSTSHLYKHLIVRMQNHNYLKYNFNYKRYLDLNLRKDKVMSEIEKHNKI